MNLLWLVKVKTLMPTHLWNVFALANQRFPGPGVWAGSRRSAIRSAPGMTDLARQRTRFAGLAVSGEKSRRVSGVEDGGETAIFP